MATRAVMKVTLQVYVSLTTMNIIGLRNLIYKNN